MIIGSVLGRATTKLQFSSVDTYVSMCHKTSWCEKMTGLVKERTEAGTQGKKEHVSPLEGEAKNLGDYKDVVR